jgi:tripartite-type tricarboxylate transporter receptor subunit TctC
MKIIQTCFVFLFCLLANSVVVAPATAQESWPAKQVKFIVPYPPGGATDLYARMLADQFIEKFNKPVVVVNVPGGAAITAINVLLKGDPDYTFMVTESVVVFGPILAKNTDYKKITPIMVFAESPNLIFRHPSVPANDFAQQMASGKSILMTTPLLQNISSIWINSISNLNVERVPYKGQDSIDAVIAGHVNYGVSGILASWNSIEQKQLAPVLIAADKRSPALPNVPTFREFGLKGEAHPNWFAVVAQKGVKSEISNALWAFLNETITSDPKFKDLGKKGVSVKSRTIKESQQYVDKEIARIKPIAEIEQ